MASAEAIGDWPAAADRRLLIICSKQAKRTGGKTPSVVCGDDVRELTVRRLADPEINIALNGDLALALIRRSGLHREEGEWVGPDGRRTGAIAEAVLWALLRIATGR